MRFLLVVFLYVLSNPIFGQGDAVTLDQLQLQRFSSKKKYPATVLRYEPDAFTDLISATLFQRKKPFSGSISENYNGQDLYLKVIDGKITEYRAAEPEDNRHQHFLVRQSDSLRYAVDSVCYKGNPFIITEFKIDSGSSRYYMLEHEYSYDNWIHNRSYAIGEVSGNKINFHEQLEDGSWTTLHNGILRNVETYRDRLIGGVIEEYNDSGILLQRYYVNARIGVYGSYYEYDSTSQTVTTGTYSVKGYPVGKWFTRYTDSSLASIQWYKENGKGEIDSVKYWLPNGKKNGEDYYFETATPSGKKYFMSCSRRWYANGSLASFINQSPLYNDTIVARFNEDGIPVSTVISVNGRVQEKIWYGNGNLKSERYHQPKDGEYITLRDSVYREWASDGKLVKQHYYSNGVFTTNNDPTNAVPGNDDAFRGVAHATIITNKFTVGNWDTSIIVPLLIVDSVAHQWAAVYEFSNESNPSVSNTYAFNTLHNIDVLDSINSYRIILNNISAARSDSSKRLVTSSPELNRFLDSLPLSVKSLTGSGRTGYRKGTDLYSFRVVTDPCSEYLNLSYINRRLEELLPGSSITLLVMSPELPSESFYISQGTKTEKGKLSISILAIAGEKSFGTRMSPDGKIEKYDDRFFCVFYIYGDGEIECTQFLRKEDLLQQYYGKENGTHPKPRR